MQINEKYGHFTHNSQEHSISELFTPGTHLPTPGSFRDSKMLFLKEKYVDYCFSVIIFRSVVIHRLHALKIY